MNSQEINDNLSMYVNGNLNVDKEIELKKQLENNSELKQEIVFLKALRNQIKNDIKSSPGEFGLQRLKRDITNEKLRKSLIKQTSSKWRSFSMVASLIVVVQMSVLIYQSPHDVSYTPLSGGEYSLNIIQVQFKHNVKEQEIRKLLLSVNGNIISGPSNNGVYRIMLNVDNKDKVITLLRDKKEVIDFVEAE